MSGFLGGKSYASRKTKIGKLQNHHQPVSVSNAHRTSNSNLRNSRAASNGINNNSNSNGLSAPKLSSRGMVSADSGGGEVQLHRPPQQKRQIRNQSQSVTAQRPQQQQTQQTNQSLQENQQNAVISMDEVMEDLRVLEQQQRDSQRNLAAIKVTKQHKLDQRSSLDTKLSALKYSNGEARFQLNHARNVLSKSQRELAAAKLRSERSNDNLHKFDDKLKKTLSTVRALHSKRRKLDEAMARLENRGSTLENEEEAMVRQVRNLDLELENAKHRETLLVKAVQDAKVKKQGFVDKTSQVRTAISSLESELTSTQKTEAAAKIGLDQKRIEIQNEQDRFHHCKEVYLSKLEDMAVKRADLDSCILELNHDVEKEVEALNEAWKTCVVIQNNEGLDPSASPNDASLDVNTIRVTLNGEKATLTLREQEAREAEDRTKALEAQLILLREQSGALTSQHNELALKVTGDRDFENQRVEERTKFVQEFESSRENLRKLEESLESLKEEEGARLIETEQEKEEVDSLTSAEKDKLVEVTQEMERLDKECADAESELEREKSDCQEEIAKAKTEADEAGEVLKMIQKRMEGLPGPDDEDRLTAAEEEELGLIDEISSKQQQILSEFPFLASVDLSSDPHASKESQIDSALSGLREFCNAKVETAREAYDKRVVEIKKKREEEEEEKMRTERARIEAEREARARELKAKLEKEEEERRKARAEADREARARELEKKREEEEDRLAERARAEADREARARELEKKREEEEDRLAERARAESEREARARELEKKREEEEERRIERGRAESERDAHAQEEEDRRRFEKENDAHKARKINSVESLGGKRDSSSVKSGSNEWSFDWDDGSQRFDVSGDKASPADKHKFAEDLDAETGKEENSAGRRRAKSGRGYGSRKIGESLSSSRSASRDSRSTSRNSLRTKTNPVSEKRSEKEAEPSSLRKEGASRLSTAAKDSHTDSVSKRRSSRDESLDRISEKESQANSRPTKSESRSDTITPKRAEKVRFQDEPTIASAKDLDKSMSLSMESSSKKRPHSIIAKSKSRDGAKAQKLDIFSQDGGVSSSKTSKKSPPSKGRSGSSSGRSGSSSKDRRSYQDSAIAVGKKTSSSKDLPLPSSRRSRSSSKGRDGAIAGAKKPSSSKDRPSSSRRTESSSSSKGRDGTIAGTKKSSSSRDRPSSSSRRSESLSSSKDRDGAITGTKKSSSSKDRPSSSSRPSGSSRKRGPLSQSSANTINSRRRKTSVNGVKKPRTGMSSQGGDFSFLD